MKLILTGFFSAQKLLDGNAVNFCQLQYLLAASDIPAPFPIHQGGPGNAALLGCFFLRQPLFFTQEQQPGSIGVPARLWFSTHARKIKSRPCRKLYFDDISSKIILRLRSVTDALEMCEMNRAATAARRERGKSTDGKIIPQLLLEIVRPVVVRVRPMISKLVNQITDANAKSFGNSQKRVQANPLLSAFDFADINRMQAGFFRQFFLAHADMLPAIPNGVTQDFQLSRTRHSFFSKA